jgi:hypothetical protein
MKTAQEARGYIAQKNEICFAKLALLLPTFQLYATLAADHEALLFD